jgi:hypothetical protein
MQNKLDIFEFFQGRPVLSLALGVVIFAIGILISDLPRMIVSPGWPTTDGEIISRRLIAHQFKEYDGDLYIDYEAYIRYKYAVDGIPYSSLSINAIDSPFYSYSIAMRYPVGKEVLVYYNPNDPTDAVLEPGIVGIFQAFDVFSYFFFGAGLYLLYLGLSRIKSIIKRKQG